MNYVQAFITNISFPTSLDELYGYVHLFNVEQILGCDSSNYIDENTSFDDSYEERYVEWTAPKWSKKGDVVFFMHSKTANATISRLKTELLNNRNNLTSNYFWTMMNALIRAKKLHSTYGGKIFAIGQVCGITKYYKTNCDSHFSGNIYAPINSIFLLENPVDISEFNSKITVSRQSSITSVSGENFNFLKEIILKKNKIIEQYFQEAVAEPLPLHNLTEEKWLMVLNKYRRSFFLEEQFRTYYVDRFLKYFGDIKSFYRECTCVKQGNPKKFVDNVIKFNGEFLLVEIKLSVSAEKDIIGQLKNYCCIDELWLDKNKKISSGFNQDKILVLDTESIYIYSNHNQLLKPVFDLDSIKSNEDIVNLRKIIEDMLC